MSPVYVPPHIYSAGLLRVDKLRHGAELPCGYESGRFGGARTRSAPRIKVCQPTLRLRQVREISEVARARVAGVQVLLKTQTQTSRAFIPWTQSKLNLSGTESVF